MKKRKDNEKDKNEKKMWNSKLIVNIPAINLAVPPAKSLPVIVGPPTTLSYANH